jgi:large repetitive protein
MAAGEARKRAVVSRFALGLGGRTTLVSVVGLVALWFASVAQAHVPAGCTGISYGGAPSSGSITVANQNDCWAVGAPAGAVIRVRVVKTSGSLSPFIHVYQKDGSLICQGGSEQTCKVTLGGNIRVKVRDGVNTGTGGYNISVQRLSNPVGCSAAPAFGGSATGTISTVGAMNCYTFHATAGDEILVNSTKTSGSITPAVDLAREDGTVDCNATTGTFLCEVTKTGRATLSVRDQSGPNTGGYKLTLQKMNNPTGCTTLATGDPGAPGDPPLAASLSVVGEVDCYRVHGNLGDQLRINIARTSGSAAMEQEVFRPNGTVMCSGTTSSAVTCPLDTTGAYTILAWDYYNTYTANYSISTRKLNSLSGCTPLTPGATPSTGTISTAAQMKCYSVHATQGDRIRIHWSNTSGGSFSPYVEFVRPNGTVPCSGYAQDLTCTAGATATYGILLRDASVTYTGNYEISTRRLNSAAGCSLIKPGAALPTTATLPASPIGVIDCYKFSAKVGDQEWIRAVKTAGSMYPYVELVKPDGTTACTTTSTDQLCAIDTTGTYTILVRDYYGLYGGSFALAIQRTNSPVSCPTLAIGATTPTSGSIGSAGAMSCYTFTANAGDQMRIRWGMTTGPGTAYAQLVRPDGTLICGNASPSELNCQLGGAGKYHLILRDASGANTSSFKIMVQRLNAPLHCTSALAPGAAPTTGSLTVAAQMDCYKLSGTAGDVVRLRLARTSGSGAVAEDIVKPNGQVQCSITTSVDQTCALDTTGTYHVFVRDYYGQYTENYAVAMQKLNKPAGCSALTLDDPPATGVSISAAAQMNCYTFTGTGGDTVRFRWVMTSGTGTPTVEVIRPGGATLCGPSYPQEVNCTLPSSGKYLVIVRDANGTNTPTYSFEAIDLANPGTCTTLTAGAAPATGSIAAGLQTDCYSMTVAPGDVVRVRMVKTSGSGYAEEDIVRPNGSVACGATTSVEQTCTIDTAGTYHVFVRDYYGTSADGYTLAMQTLDAPAGCSSLSVDPTPTAGSIANVGGMTCYTFSATTGEHVDLRYMWTSGTSFQPEAEIVGPDGRTVCGPSYPSELTCALGSAGTYTVVVRDYSGPYTGGFNIALQDLNSPVGCSSLGLGGTPTDGNFAAAGQTDCYTVTGGAGQTLWFQYQHSTSTSVSPTVALYKPNGSLECGTGYAPTMACTLDASGTFTLLIRDSSGGYTGPYSVLVQRVDSPSGCTTLSYGAAPTSVAMSTPGELDCYTVPASIGDHVLVRWINTAGTSFYPYLQGFDANGSTICGVSGPSALTCTADTNGNMTFFVRDASDFYTGTYSIAVQNVNSPTGCGSLTVGGSTDSGSLAAAAQIDCYTFTGTSGEHVDTNMTRTSGSFTVWQELVRPNGTTICGPTTSADQTCTLDVSGTYTLIVGDYSAIYSGNYTVKVS